MSGAVRQLWSVARPGAQKRNSPSNNEDKEGLNVPLLPPLAQHQMRTQLVGQYQVYKIGVETRWPYYYLFHPLVLSLFDNLECVPSLGMEAAPYTEIL